MIIISLGFKDRDALQYTESSDRVSYSGQLYIDGIPADSIKAVIVPELIYFELGKREITAKCDDSGRFKLNVDSVNQIQSVIFVIYGQRKISLTGNYAEPGDQINIMLTGSGKNIEAKFSGTGAAKYNYAFEARNINSFEDFLKFKDVPEYKAEPGTYDSTNLAIQLRFNKFNTDRYKKLFEKFKLNFSPTISEVIASDIAGFRNSAVVATVDKFYLKSPNNSILNFYKSEPASFADTNNSIFKGMSSNYVEWLFLRSGFEAKLKYPGRKVAIIDLYNQIKSNYKGYLRERVLLRYLMGRPPGNELEYRNSLEDAIKYFRKGSGLDYLKHQLSVVTNGESYRFSLPDENGKNVQLSDFKGKIVLVDVWFTGCVPCLELAKKLRTEIIPEFQKTDNVVFISVNVDRSPSQWKASLKSGLYTDAGSVNLFTEGKAFNHPFIKFYNITGCPSLLIFDKMGKLITSNPAIAGNELMGIIQRSL